MEISGLLVEEEVKDECERIGLVFVCDDDDELVTLDVDDDDDDDGNDVVVVGECLDEATELEILEALAGFEAKGFATAKGEVLTPNETGFTKPDVDWLDEFGETTLVLGWEEDEEEFGCGGGREEETETEWVPMLLVLVVTNFVSFEELWDSGFEGQEIDSEADDEDVEGFEDGVLIFTLPP